MVRQTHTHTHGCAHTEHRERHREGEGGSIELWEGFVPRPLQGAQYEDVHNLEMACLCERERKNMGDGESKREERGLVVAKGCTRSGGQIRYMDF